MRLFLTSSGILVLVLVLCLDVEGEVEEVEEEEEDVALILDLSPRFTLGLALFLTLDFVRGSDNLLGSCVLVAVLIGKMAAVGVLEMAGVAAWSSFVTVFAAELTFTRRRGTKVLLLFSSCLNTTPSSASSLDTSGIFSRSDVLAC